MLSKTKKYVRQLVNINIYIKMHGATIKMIKICFGLHVKYRVFLSYFIIKLEFSRQIFEKYSDIKLHENPPIGSRFVPCGRAD
jgi:hypothetical protein